MKNTLLYIVFILSTLPLQAQNIDGSFNPSSNFLPKSPEAATIMMFQDLPTNPYTGTASVAVPITSMSENDLSVNISLQYHASSVPVNTLSNWVGANWKLNGVSMISRKTKGLPDDADLGMGFLEFREDFNYEDNDSDPDNSVLDWLTNQNTSRFEQLASGCFDVSPDEFYFDLNDSGSGTFAFDWENDMPIVNSADDIEVVYYETAPNSNQITLWELRDAKGVIYTFSDLEITSSESDFSFANICTSGTQSFTSSWYLTKMESPNIIQDGGLQFIEFQYQDYTLDYDWQWFETRTFGIATNNSDCGGITSMPNISSSRTIIYGKRLSAIRTSNNYFSIDFIANNLRTDIQDLEDAQNFYRLDEIQVKGATGDVMYSYALDYEYKGRLLLSSVQKIGSDGTTLPPYLFEYNQTFMPAIKSKSIDHWGFYNGANNTTLLPNYLHKLIGGPFIYFEGGDRNPSLSHALANVMSSVIYPTGAKVLLDYELNEYSSVNGQVVENQNQYIAINMDDYLPVSSQLENGDFIESTNPYIAMNSPDDEVLVEITITGQTSWTFGGFNTLPQAWIEDQNGNSIASFILEPAIDENGNNIAPYFQSFKRYILLPPDTYRLRAKARTEPSAEQVDFININIKWSDVDVTMPRLRKTAGGVRLKEIIYQDGDGTETNRRSFSYEMDDGSDYSSGVIYAEPQYTYESTNIVGSQSNGIIECDYVQLVGASRYVLASTGGSYLGYRRVEESIGISGIGGKIVHEFTSPHTAPDGLDITKPFGPPLSNSFKTSLSSQQTSYNVNGQIVQQIDNNYVYPQTDISSAKISLGKYAPPPYTGSLQALLALGADYNSRDFGDKFAWSFRPLRLGLSLPSDNTTWLDGISHTTQYTYDSQYEHHQVVATTTINSDGKVHRTDIKYAYEISTDMSVSQTLRDVAMEMLNRNMVAIPLEQKRYVNNVLQGGGRTEYAFFQGQQMILPQRFMWILHTGTEVEQGTIDGYTQDAYPTATTRRGYPQRTFLWTNGLLQSTQYDTWSESYTYFPNTRLQESYTAIDGQITNLTFDGLQRLKTASSRGGAVVSTNNYHYTYATEGTPNYIQSQTVFSDGTPSQTTIQTFDGTGRSLKTLLNGVLKNEIVYDNIGRVEKQTHLPGNFMTLQYDNSPLNRVVRQTFPVTHGSNGFFTETEYSSENGYFKTIFTDENAKETITLTDILGRTERVINADGNATIYEYDDRNNPTKIIPPIGDYDKTIFEYEYDARNRRTAVKIPGAGQKFFTYYDSDDLLHTSTDANGNNLAYFYDDYGREVNTFLDGLRIRSNFYDENGGRNIGKMTRSQVKLLESNDFLETVYSYDDFGRLAQTSADNHLDIGGGQLGNDIMTTTYNHADWVTQTVRNHTGYESLDIAQSFDYDNFGRVTQKTHSINGEQGAILCDNAWNNRDQMTRKVIGGNLQSVDYLYNERGFLSRINQPLDLFGPPSSITRACEDNFVPTNDPNMEAEVFCGLQEIDLNTLLNVRFDQGIAFDCYNPCENTGGVQGQPTCTAQEQNAQLASITTAQEAMENHYATTTNQLCDDGSMQEVWRPNLSGLNLPTTLYRIRLCNGDEIFVFEDALQNITGTYYFVQEIEIVDVRQLFQVTNNQGIAQTLTLEQLLLFVLEGDDITVGDYQHNDGSCAPTPPDCTPEEQQDQQNALLQIMGTGFAPRDTDDIDLPTTLQRVLLCDGTEVYLFPDELAEIPGTYTILQTIDVTNAQQLFDRGTTITNLDLDDLFSVGLYYAENNPGDNLSTARKNGDISWMTWQTKGRETQSYTFQYDNLNRLTSANHAYIDNLRNYVFNKHYDVSFSYDANGNITNLSRKRMPTDPNECGVLMDELGYSYDVVNSGNQLLNITDMAETDKGFKFTNGASDYQYDANGNLTHDFHKGYVAAYNFLNLPEVFDFGDGKTVDLLYDANGMKLRKTVIGADPQTGTTAYTKDYLGGIEYNNQVLEAVYHDEGRAVTDGNGGFEYQFRIADHLNNTRVMFADLNSDGEVTEEEIITENNYYPFGLEMEGQWNQQTNPEQNYLFTGFERQHDYGVNLDIAQFRTFDFTSCRWLQIDPLASEMTAWSPYNYGFNNPVKFTDPDGLAPENCCPDDNNPQADASFLPENTISYLNAAPVGSQNVDDARTISPVENPVISSEFGIRTHPVTGKQKGHKGIDIVQADGKARGKDIVAPLNGEVISVKSRKDGNGAGNRISIKAAKDNKVHNFFHLEDKNFASGLKKGTEISRGDKLGQIGTTGTSTGAHLHYEVRTKRGGKALNPRNENSGLTNAPTKREVRQRKRQASQGQGRPTGFFNPIGTFNPNKIN